jgi:hypothetical protein
MKGGEGGFQETTDAALGKISVTGLPGKKIAAKTISDLRADYPEVIQLLAGGLRR